MKYIRFDVKITDDFWKPVFVTFDNLLTHRDIAERLHHYVVGQYDTTDVKLISAGFIGRDGKSCHGSSESLGLSCKQDDTDWYLESLTDSKF